MGNYNDIFDRFYDTVKDKFASYCLKAPLKTLRRKRLTPVAPSINLWSPKVNKRKQNLWKEYKNRPSDAELEAFKLYPTMLKSIIRRTKTEYFTKRCVDCSKDIKKMCDVIKEVSQPSMKPECLHCSLSL